MNRIVREHYPVSKLPEDLREGFAPDAEVRVTVDAPGPDAAKPEQTRVPKPGSFSQFKHLRQKNFASDADVDAYVSGLRDEWTDRER